MKPELKSILRQLKCMDKHLSEIKKEMDDIRKIIFEDIE